MICSSSSEDDEDDETIPDAPYPQGKGGGQGGGGGNLKVPNGSAPRYDKTETSLLYCSLLHYINLYKIVLIFRCNKSKYKRRERIEKSSFHITRKYP